MAFAMVLPNHPFSDEMYKSISNIVTMYPNVKTVVGSGYEFSEMCSQYGVRSFPKLLLYTKGHLYKSLSILKPSDLSGEFAKWTKSYPRTYPRKHIDSSLYILLNQTEKFHITLNKTFTGISSISFSYPAFIFHSTEPIMGSSEFLARWDSNGYLMIIACFYIYMRCLWWHFKKTGEQEGRFNVALRDVN